MAHFLYTLNLGAAIFMLVAMALVLARLLSGPTLYDRVLAVNSFGTTTILFLCVFSFVIGRTDGIDIAILYALMNFIATIAVLKFFRYRALDMSLEDAHIDKPTIKTGKKTGPVKRGRRT
ncbi:MAG: cation:proton antiporter [Robiginitomaculum sp.]|nr:MAG: cation:proton antiporter [Robiginitomaculum sp.]